MTFENTFPSNFNAKNFGIAMSKAAQSVNQPLTVIVGGATTYNMQSTNRHHKIMQKFESQKTLLKIQKDYWEKRVPKSIAEEHVKFLGIDPSCLDPRTPQILPLKRDNDVSFGTSSRSSGFASITASYEQKNYSRSKKPQEVYCLVEAGQPVLSPREERQVLIQSATQVLCMLAGVFAVLTIYNIFFPEKKTTTNFSDIDEKQAEKRESDLLKKNISEILVKLTSIESETESIKNQMQKLSSEIDLLKQEYRK